MKKEVDTAIRTTEDLGDNVFTLAMIAPDAIENSIKLGRDIVVIPISVLKDATSFTAGKVDDAVDIVV